jgi:hypothetical protein
MTGYDVITSHGERVSVPATQTSVVATGLAAADQTFTVDAVKASGASQPSAPSARWRRSPAGRITPQAPGASWTHGIGPGGMSSPLGQGRSVNLQVTGRAGVPSSGVSAVVLNVTVTNTTASSFLIVWPAGFAMPTGSNLNWVAGKTVPNLVEVALGSSGQVSIYNLAGNVDVVVDVEGWVGDATNSSGPAGTFKALTPSRLLDTRDGGGPLGPARC